MLKAGVVTVAGWLGVENKELDGALCEKGLEPNVLVPALNRLDEAELNAGVEEAPNIEGELPNPEAKLLGVLPAPKVVLKFTPNDGVLA
mgnify:CR=1 FL=1